MHTDLKRLCSLVGVQDTVTSNQRHSCVLTQTFCLLSVTHSVIHTKGYFGLIPFSFLPGCIDPYIFSREALHKSTKNSRKLTTVAKKELFVG